MAGLDQGGVFRGNFGRALTEVEEVIGDENTRIAGVLPKVSRLGVVEGECSLPAVRVVAKVNVVPTPFLPNFRRCAFFTEPEPLSSEIVFGKSNTSAICMAYINRWSMSAVLFPSIQSSFSLARTPM